MKNRTLISGKKIFITGAGYLTTHLIRKWSKDPTISFVVYSRDEGKHEILNREFPQVKCIMGDIKDLDRMSRAAKGCEIGVFTASTKCIDRVEANLEESLYTIGIGAINSRKVAEDNNFIAATFLSTDKATLPQTSYGYLKAFASSVFLNSPSDTRFSVVRYGNISASHKSLLDIIFDYIKSDKPITLYHPEMTRFFLNIDRGIECIEHALNLNRATVVPKIESFLVKNIFDIYRTEFGLKYKVGGLRLNEKIHEDLISISEAPCTTFDSEINDYIIYTSPQIVNIKFGIDSSQTIVSYSETLQYLIANRFFQKL
jgi:UDP-N-acetylglucosamine 4,6-dehydratase